MKNFKLISFCCGLSLFATTGIAHAGQFKFQATDNSVATKMCIFAVENNRAKLKATIRKMGADKRKYAVNEIRCNNLSPAKFAFKYHAFDTLEFLNRHSYRANKVEHSITIHDVAKLSNSDATPEKPITIQVSTN